MANIWKRGPVTENPYYETAFHALGITPDVLSRAEIDQKAGERRQAVGAVPDHYRLGERALTQADINRARQVLLDPTQRILEELLVHKPESLQVDEIERLQARLKMPDWSGDTQPSGRLTFLLRVVQELALAYLQNLPPVEIPPFSIDTQLIPPFGLLEEDEDD